MIDNMIIQELVTPEVYRDYGEKAWDLLDPRILNVIQFLGSAFGRIVINNWHRKGGYSNSGLRTTYGSKGSCHRYGMAFDLKFLDCDIKKVYNYIKAHQEELFVLGLRRVEHIDATPTWLHIDSKPFPHKAKYGEIYFFKP